MTAQTEPVAQQRPYPVLKRECDVVIVGAGIVGMLLGLLLKEQGLSVQLYERQSAVYPLPRAVVLSEDNVRLLEIMGLRDVLGGFVVCDDFPWKDAQGNEIACISNALSSNELSEFYPNYLISQPLVENAISIRCELKNLQLYRNWNFTKFDDRDPTTGYRKVYFERPPLSTSQIFFQNQVEVKCRWLIGADGANSSVRRAAGITITDFGFNHEWLVVDTLPDDYEASSKNLPRAQYCDPERPTTAIASGPRRHRWEFMRLPGESDKELLNPARLWSLLKPFGVNPEKVEIERAVIYQFQSKLVDSFWEDGIGLVGDAGLSSEKLMQSYTSERRSQADAIIKLAIHLGQPLCITDKKIAVKTHGDMLQKYLDSDSEHTKTTPPNLIGEKAMLLDKHYGGSLELRAPFRHRDGVVGIRRHVEWVILHSAACKIPAESVKNLERHQVRMEPLSKEVDVTGKYHAWISKILGTTEQTKQQELWCILRPDMYVYGMGNGPETFRDALLELESDLKV
ncbi:hypothetical protein EX895_003625 [Sporisorium graminicola]|uniref:FAD-binding domain-containing protein n=1 Tax=Sporisorium graminicola TaxID=280036 RepID=A0A4U7KUE7_9BASI|nr:hypothetical protein EX895_003625 [Sporisorium graminicola]TKY86948.1 hypothetical protein EX895_003625 [Sporisorium graminicola]